MCVCSIIISKIDKDGNGFVTEDELKEWIQYVQKRYIINDTDRMWKDHQPDDDNVLSWHAYQKRTFGYEDGEWSATEKMSVKNYLWCWQLIKLMLDQ